MDLTQVLQRPLVTEKSIADTAQGRYAFAVDKKATKWDIKHAVERFFGVKVSSVKTHSVPGKKRRVGRQRHQIVTPSWKKAIVQLSEGEKIDVFEVGGEEKKQKK